MSKILQFCVLIYLLVACKGGSGGGGGGSAPPAIDDKVDDGGDNSPPDDGKDTKGDDIPAPGVLVLDAALDGAVDLSDVPTIAYDVTADVATIMNDPSDPILSGTLSVSTGGLSLTGSGFDLAQSESIITSSLSGSATFDGELTSTNRLGSLEFTNFIARQGFPKIKSGAMEFDFDVSSTTITGKMTGSNLNVGDVEFGVEADYDLYLDGTLWRGTMTGKILSNGKEGTFTYDYDTPILTSVEAVALDGSGNEVGGAVTDGGKVRLKLKANSNTALNWVNVTWDSPLSNLEGGGYGVSYCVAGSCGAQEESKFFEESKGYWTHYRDFEINEYKPSGNYKWTFSVKNSAELVSREMSATATVINSLESGAPEITSATLETANLTDGDASTVTLHLVAESIAPVDWINLGLEGPSGNLEGGGSGTTFDDCDDHAADSSHPCFEKTGNFWYYTRTWNFSKWAENGTYTFENVSVENAADLTSANADPLNFTIANNQVAGTPVITSIVVKHYEDGEDPVTDGDEINGECLVDSALTDPLRVALIIEASSTAPVDWLNISFEGPSGNLEGGGSGQTATDLGSGNWRIVKTHQIDEPINAPEGRYYWQNITVENEGEKESAAYGSALEFDLKSSCP
jgi:hypothetical protein